MKKLLFLFFCLSATTLFAQSTETVKSIYFATAKHDISPESETILSEIIAELAKYETYTLTIQGNTDDKGNNKYNKALSERRANATKDFFIKNNITEQNIAITAYGEEKPIADNTDETGKQRNRRVDIFVRGVMKAVKKPTPIVKAVELPKEEVKPIKPVTDINDLYRLLTNTPQRFEIDTRKDAVLRGSQGTVLYYKANSLQTSCPRVTITLKEVLKKSDMVIENLSTMTKDGQVLETGGMIKINAIDCNNKPIMLKNGQNIVFAVPATDGFNPQMNIYDGLPAASNVRMIKTQTLHNNPHDSTIIWDITQMNNGGLGNVSRSMSNECLRCCVDYENCHKVRFMEAIRGIFSKRQALYNKKNRYCTKIASIKVKSDKIKLDILALQKKLPSLSKMKDSTQYLLAKKKIVTQQESRARLLGKMEAYNIQTMAVNDIIAPRARPNTPPTMAEPAKVTDKSVSTGIKTPKIPLESDSVALKRLLKCSNLLDIAQKTGINDILAFAKALNPKFDINSSADLYDLTESITQLYLSKIENNGAGTNLSDVQYYLGATGAIGNWSNCDALQKMNQSQLATVSVDIPRLKDTDCKIILKKRNIALYSDASDVFRISKVIKNEDAWIVALKYEAQQPFLALKKIKVNADATEKVEFVAMTVTEIKGKLLELNER